MIALRQDGLWRYPDFQFERNSGNVRPGVEALLQGIGGVVDHWRVMDWPICMPPHFSHRRPIDLRDQEAARNDIVALFRRSFMLDVD